MKALNYCIGGLLLLGVNSAYSQIDDLKINTNRHCSFSGKDWDDELYVYPLNPNITQYVEEILEASSTDMNFTLLQSNVENVAAVFDTTTGLRYLLFSPDYMYRARTKLQKYGPLVHEIAHHVLEHSLDSRYRQVEELEADEFMGYILCRIGGITMLESVFKLIEVLPGSYFQSGQLEQRKQAIEAGWRRAENFISLNSSGFETDPDRDAFLLARFDFPPCCSSLPLSRQYFSQASRLGDVAGKLEMALKSRGYYYRKFMSVPNGFALVTQMEQYRSDFTCWPDEKRWSTVPVHESFKGFVNYISRLVYGEKALYRVFVFVVTNRGYGIDGAKVTKDEAAKWFNRARSCLPASIADDPFSSDYYVDALVYEFVVPQSNRVASQRCPTIDTEKHLRNAGILDALKRR
jgi:hypothetical protein